MPARMFSSVRLARCDSISSLSRLSPRSSWSRRQVEKLRRRVKQRRTALISRFVPYDGHLAYQQENATALLGKQQVCAQRSPRPLTKPMPHQESAAVGCSLQLSSRRAAPAESSPRLRSSPREPQCPPSV